MIRRKELRMSNLIWRSKVFSLTVTLVVFGFLSESEAQMEKRDCELYLTKEFKEAKPAIGSKAPELVLMTLDGKEVSLSDYLDKPVVIVKGGYT